MSIERQEIVATLQSEKERYDLLIANSMDELEKLRQKEFISLTSHQKKELEQLTRSMEQEINMLHSLSNYILFKIKILEIKNHAS